MDAANDVDFQDVAVTDLALQEFTPIRCDPCRWLSPFAEQ